MSRAFANARRLLKPHGIFIFSVPYSLDQETLEHFPDLHDYRLVEKDGAWRLENRTSDGRRQVFSDLVFHGGPGSTLEMRLFSRNGLIDEFVKALRNALKNTPESRRALPTSRNPTTGLSGLSPGRSQWWRMRPCLDSTGRGPGVGQGMGRGDPQYLTAVPNPPDALARARADA